MRDKVTRQCPQTTTFEEKRRAEADSNRSPSAYQPNALPLGHTGSRVDYERGGLLHSSTHAATANAVKKYRGFGKNEAGWTRTVEIPGCGRNMRGYDQIILIINAI